MRKEAKSSGRTKCSYAKCTKDPFKKNLGYYRNNLYFCNKSHYKKWKKEQNV